MKRILCPLALKRMTRLLSRESGALLATLVVEYWRDERIALFVTFDISCSRKSLHTRTCRDSSGDWDSVDLSFALADSQMLLLLFTVVLLPRSSSLEERSH